jgi:hypothetical protein
VTFSTAPLPTSSLNEARFVKTTQRLLEGKAMPYKSPTLDRLGLGGVPVFGIRSRLLSISPIPPSH